MPDGITTASTPVAGNDDYDHTCRLEDVVLNLPSGLPNQNFEFHPNLSATCVEEAARLESSRRRRRVDVELRVERRHRPGRDSRVLFEYADRPSKRRRPRLAPATSCADRPSPTFHCPTPPARRRRAFGGDSDCALGDATTTRTRPLRPGRPRRGCSACPGRAPSRARPVFRIPRSSRDRACRREPRRRSSTRRPHRSNAMTATSSSPARQRCEDYGGTKSASSGGGVRA